MAGRGIIFDLDGTLLDTIEDIAAAANRGLGRFGFPPRSIDEYKRFVGEGIGVLVHRALPQGFRDEELFPRIREAVVREYSAAVVDRTRVYPGVAELLRALEARSVPMAVLSNKPHDLCVESVRRLLPDAPFATVRGACDGRPRKPDPAATLEVAALLGLPPGEILLVGDSETDIEAAAGADMKAVAVTWGFRTREELERLKPFALVDRPEEVLNLL